MDLISRKETLLRILVVLFLAAAACLVGLDRETEVLFTVLTKTATFKDLNALFALVWVASAAAACNLLLLIFRYCTRKDAEICASYRYLDWGLFFLDQVLAYVVFAANSAAMEASMIAITGENSVGWMKMCDKFTRFCFQIGGALSCGYLASLTMILISCISAYNLFRKYSPKRFLLLKHAQ